MKDNTTGDVWVNPSILRRLNDHSGDSRTSQRRRCQMLVTISKEEHGPDGCVGSQRLFSFVQDPLSVSSIILVNDAHTFVSIGVVVPRAPTWLWPTLADWSQHLRKSPAGTQP